MSTLVRFLEAPAWPILLWCGLAASLAAALILSPARGRRAHRVWPRALFAGCAIFAPLYGLAFESLGRADVLLGAAFGFAHGLFALALALRSPAPRDRGLLVRTLAAWIVYGTTVGFLYPVPAA